jgi:hypothetical protein
LAATVHAAPQTGRSVCAFNLRVTPALCSRLLHTRRAAVGGSRLVRTTGTLVYSSQPFGGVVDISSVGAKGLKPVGELVLAQGASPLGMTVDASQNLYVAIAALGSGQPAVDVFPRGATQPSKIYTDGLTAPVDVAVDYHGTVYVANLAHAGGGGCEQGSGPGGDVVEYANGSTTPTATITDFPGCPSAVAVDASANLYLTYLYYPSSGFAESDVVEYAYQSTSGKHLHLRVPGGPELGGIAVDSAGELVVENVQDDATLNQILTFAKGAKRPRKPITYGGDGWGTAFKFFALLDNHLFAPAYVSELFGFVVDTVAEFDYPTGRQLFAQNPALAPAPFVYGFAVSADR